MGRLVSLRRQLRSATVRRALDREIDGLRQRRHGLAAGDPAACYVLNVLANRLRDRYLAAGSRADLDEALDLYREALASTDDTGERNVVSGNFAVALLDRFHASDDLADLEESITLTRDAAAAAPPGSSERARHLINLTNGLNERYARTRQHVDLVDAIDAGEQALELPLDPTTVAGARLNLAAALLARNLPNDAGRATDLLRSAAAGFAPGSPGHQQAVVGLAIARGAGETGQPGALGLDADDDTIASLTEVVRSTPVGSPRHSAALHALGRGRWARYERTSDRDELDAAIAALRAAVDDAPNDADMLPRYLNDLGRALTELSYTSDSAAGLAAALEVWVRAQRLLEDRFDAVDTRYQVGQRELSVQLGLAERIISVYLELADRATSTESRDRMLRNAVWSAEAAKSRMLVGLIGRGDVPPPRDVPADVVAREREIVEELRLIDTGALAARDLAAVDVDHATRRRALRAEVERLWLEIERSAQDGPDYVALRRGQPLTWNTIADLVAQTGPDTAVVSMFMTNSRALMFVMRDGAAPQVAQIDIDRAGWLDVVDRFDAEVRRGDGPGTETWHERLTPLLRSAIPYVDGAERVVLAPTGWSLQLPWAAVARRAGWRTPDGRSMPIVTVESLALMSRLLARPRTAGRSAVVIGNPTGDLPHAEAEARAVAAVLGVEPLIGRSATKAAVIAGMRTGSIAHIAGHASLATGAPLDSAIVLADGRLTAREIMAERLRLELIVLSACETGAAESLGGYEYAGLTQSFQLAGARAVIASLWKVDDPATARLINGLYATWFAGADLARALRDASDATNADASASDDRRREVNPSRPAAVRPTTYYRDPFVLSGDWSIAPR